MLQILILWDSENPDDAAMYDRLIKGFEKLGSWNVELPPRNSIYKTMLTLDKINKEDKNGK